MGVFSMIRGRDSDAQGIWGKDVVLRDPHLVGHLLGELYGRQDRDSQVGIARIKQSVIMSGCASPHSDGPPIPYMSVCIYIYIYILYI